MSIRSAIRPVSARERECRQENRPHRRRRGRRRRARRDPPWCGADGCDRGAVRRAESVASTFIAATPRRFRLPVSAVGSGDHRGSEAVSCVRRLLWSGPAPPSVPSFRSSRIRRSSVRLPFVRPSRTTASCEREAIGELCRGEDPGRPRGRGVGLRVWSGPRGQLGRRGQRRGV